MGDNPARTPVRSGVCVAISVGTDVSEIAGEFGVAVRVEMTTLFAPTSFLSGMSGAGVHPQRIKSRTTVPAKREGYFFNVTTFLRKTHL